MRNREEDLRCCQRFFDAFAPVGALEDGGVTRLGYTAAEDEMHRRFASLARELGCRVETDEVGNTFAQMGEEKEYILIGSHLDSVVDGGRYDGVAGVIAGLMILRWAKEEGLALPVKAAAFRCEESSNFGHGVVGSGLVTGDVEERELADLTGQDGERLGDIFAHRGLSLTPRQISGVKEYLELHIEQGRVLESSHTGLGIVTTIAGNRRHRLRLTGMADHSGATPMDLRQDALCAGAEIILAVERMGREEARFQSVATVGVVENRPNVMNVIPGQVELGVDLRGRDPESLDRMETALTDLVREICERRGIRYEQRSLGRVPPVEMSRRIRKGLESAAQTLGLRCREMPSGAGHDAMHFARHWDTGMVFIPCQGGISHNRAEKASLEDLLDGARVIFEYLKGAGR
ncbi:MAG: M20 family metallo-hydrolase [Oscillospiraceae bacterium]|nr:M20 family metallo-hydrolase [Oscillospiraceae bacterium]